MGNTESSLEGLVMKFIETFIKNVFVIELEKLEDNRGFFARTWCEKEFKEHGLNPNLSQISIALNKKKGTIRGMHFQLPPHEEAKLVRCPKGSIYDVVIDFRPSSPTFKQWVSTELTSKNHKMVYLPEGCAHGYQTLEDDTEVIYHMSVPHFSELYRGVRWNDPAFGIKWPINENIIISDKDKSYPLFNELNLAKT